MGVDTKGFVLTDCKDAMLVGQLLLRALDKLIMQGSKAEFSETRWRGSPEVRERWRHVKISLSPEASMLTLDFVYAGEKRALSVFFDCDCDHVEYGPSSLSMSLGCWGSSELLMRTALAALSMLGTAWLDVNDSDSVDAAPLPGPRMPVLAAIGHNLLGGDHLVTLAKARASGTPWLQGTCREVFGVGGRDLHRMVGHLERRDVEGTQLVTKVAKAAAAAHPLPAPTVPVSETQASG